MNNTHRKYKNMIKAGEGVQFPHQMTAENKADFVGYCVIDWTGGNEASLQKRRAVAVAEGDDWKIRVIDTYLRKMQ